MMQYRDVSNVRSPFPLPSEEGGGGARSVNTKSQLQSHKFLKNLEDEDEDEVQGYGNDRIQNELLDEICNDFGIKDAMDLDFLDFDPGAPYMFGGEGQGQSGGMTELVDMGASGEGFINRTSATDNEKLAVAGMARIDDSPLTLPINPPSSVKSVSEKVDSPTVSSSSSCEDTQAKLSNSASCTGSMVPVNSPSVHSTTPSVPDAAATSSTSTASSGRPSSVDASEPSPGGNKNEGNVEASSSCPSAALPPPRTSALDSVVSQSPRHSASGSLDTLNHPVVSTAPTTLSKTSGFTASLKKQDLYTSFSQPASPAKKNANSSSLMKAQSYQDNLNQVSRSLASQPSFQQVSHNSC